MSRGRYRFADPRTEQARRIVATGMAQRLPADTVVERLAREGLLAEGLGTDRDHDSWRN